ncbi:mandelate racemase/muconate lactonizing enzyme family protein [Brevibacterium yomogidense]|uniref:mandelate racemase/muconate lactonizing enzyme family protein n=1 Tax=Brevibacterium yomogidense TaxID=946573 RepID=UPI0018DF474C|nr:mandelate racemase/muconate lactonizing enzyme family protein [Brevibacterium yomogidense]
MTITRLSTRLLTGRLGRSWGAGVPHNHVVVVTVETDRGDRGTGFSWTPTIGARAVQALLENDIADFVRGRDEAPEPLWDALRNHLHEAGPGLATIAQAGLDLALWDLRARRSGASLATHLGPRRDDVAVYGSGVNLHYPLDELVEQVRGWVAAGFDSVKVKVGRPDLAEDVERISAVRDVLGPGRGLMIDANQRWDLPTARRAIASLERFDLTWVEEPLCADDLAGHRSLRAHTDVPVALGENLHTVHRFHEFIAADAVDVVQPNIVRVGGLTPFRRIVESARVRSVGVAPHLLHELSGQVALTLAEPTAVEVVDGGQFATMGLLAEPSPVTVDGGRLRGTGAPGLGLTFADESPTVTDG